MFYSGMLTPLRLFFPGFTLLSFRHVDPSWQLVVKRFYDFFAPLNQGSYVTKANYNGSFKTGITT